MAKKEIKKEVPEEIKSVELKKEVTPVEAPADQIETKEMFSPDEPTGVENLEKMMDDKIEQESMTPGPKYEANDVKIERYLRGAKPYDMITQRKKGGPFIGGRGEIYIPLSLIKK